MKRLGQIQVQSLAGAVAHRLRNAIIEGELLPGERLTEQKLAKDLGSSRPTVREALRELELGGFVRKIANKGTYVMSLTEADIAEVLQVRMALEGIAIEEAAVKITVEVSEKLKCLVAEMEAAAENQDRTRFYSAELSFHRTIWDLAGNDHLATALSRLAFSLVASILSGQNEFAFPQAVEQHRFILNGLLSKNPAQARDVFFKGTLDFWSKYQNVHLPPSAHGEQA